jgi:hypothetical protein
MNTHAKQFDTSKLSPRDRRAYELGMALVSKKLAAAKLAAIRRKEAPKSFRIVPGATVREFGAVQPVKRSGGTRRHVVFSTLLAP